MATSTKSKRWLITGASQGLGLAMVLSALKAGHEVLAGARDPTKAAASHPKVEEAGGKWFKLDVASSDVPTVVSEAIQSFGGIDVLVNNAGVFAAGTIEDLTYATYSASVCYTDRSLD